jgi:hypothetical protein
MTTTNNNNDNVPMEDPRANLARRGKSIFLRSMSSVNDDMEQEQQIDDAIIIQEEEQKKKQLAPRGNNTSSGNQSSTSNNNKPLSDENTDSSDDEDNTSPTKKKKSLLGKLARSFRGGKKKNSTTNGNNNTTAVDGDDDFIHEYTTEMLKVDSTIRDVKSRTELTKSIQSIPGSWTKMIQFVATMQEVKNGGSENEIKTIMQRFVQGDSPDAIADLLTPELRMKLWARDIPWQELRTLLWEAKSQIVLQFFNDNVIFMRLCLV